MSGDGLCGRRASRAGEGFPFPRVVVVVVVVVVLAERRISGIGSRRMLKASGMLKTRVEITKTQYHCEILRACEKVNCVEYVVGARFDGIAWIRSMRVHNKCAPHLS